MSEAVLVVDDDTKLAYALVLRLRAAGYQTAHADCGLAAVQAAEQLRPNAIILDIRLPDIDGFAVCERIRAVPALRNTPVIFVSANSSATDRQRARSCGGSAFFAKPCPAGPLLSAIRELMMSADLTDTQRSSVNAGQEP